MLLGALVTFTSTPGRYPCPTCNRLFNEDAARRHFPVCKRVTNAPRAREPCGKAEPPSEGLQPKWQGVVGIFRGSWGLRNVWGYRAALERSKLAEGIGK